MPEVKISIGAVMIGDRHHTFSNVRHTLKEIDVRNEGMVNIIAITYTRTGQDIPGEIRIPVPKGKLREAMVIWEKLEPV